MQTPKYDLHILNTAQNELEEIARLHLELVGPNSARQITNGIYKTLERLQSFPRSGIVPNDSYLRQAGYRFVICEKYLCFYRLIDKSVFVYHIVHGASNYPTIMNDTPQYE